MTAVASGTLPRPRSSIDGVRSARPGKRRILAGSVTLALLGLTLWRGVPDTTGSTTALAAQQDPTVVAVLEPRQPDVQWWPARGRGWRSIAASQPLGVGDQVRTGPGAEARLVYFEGSMTELRPESALLLDRAERSPDGALVVRLVQPQGSAVHHVGPSADPAASFEVDTVAALVVGRGATMRVQVASDGTTRIARLPEGPDGTVWVQSTTEGKQLGGPDYWPGAGAGGREPPSIASTTVSRRRGMRASSARSRDSAE